MFNAELTHYLSRHTIYLNQIKQNYHYLHIVYYYSMKC